MKKLLGLIIVIACVVMFMLFQSVTTENTQTTAAWWRFQSIDTMKYSRDLSREKLDDASFNGVIDQQVQAIAATGATHVAIATPYDEEFYPILKRWVAAARHYHLNVWFRGNWSGWEGWFDYPKITREEHIKKTQQFIEVHRDIFVDGDIFTACPECENGGPGDPRQTGDISGHRKFLIDEYNATQAEFRAINKNVASNFDSMNGDVARVVMDHATTAALGGVVTIDHYVGTPDELISGVKEIAQSSGGKIVLGEFGAPIPDLNGDMTEEQQAVWIKEALSKLILLPEVEGVNYWTNEGSSTALWRDDGIAKHAVEAIKSIYSAPSAQGQILDAAGGGISGAYITIGDRHFFTDSKGFYALPYFKNYSSVKVDAVDFYGKTIAIDPSVKQVTILAKQNEDLIFKIRKFFHNL